MDTGTNRIGSLECCDNSLSNSVNRDEVELGACIPGEDACDLSDCPAHDALFEICRGLRQGLMRSAKCIDWCVYNFEIVVLTRLAMTNHNTVAELNDSKALSSMRPFGLGDAIALVKLVVVIVEIVGEAQGVFARNRLICRPSDIRCLNAEMRDKRRAFGVLESLEKLISVLSLEHWP